MVSLTCLQGWNLKALFIEFPYCGDGSVLCGFGWRVKVCICPVERVLLSVPWGTGSCQLVRHTSVFDPWLRECVCVCVSPKWLKVQWSPEDTRSTHCTWQTSQTHTHTHTHTQRERESEHMHLQSLSNKHTLIVVLEWSNPQGRGTRGQSGTSRVTVVCECLEQPTWAEALPRAHIHIWSPDLKTRQHRPRSDISEQNSSCWIIFLSSHRHWSGWDDRQDSSDATWHTTAVLCYLFIYIFICVCVCVCVCVCACVRACVHVCVLLFGLFISFVFFFFIYV